MVLPPGAGYLRKLPAVTSNSVTPPSGSRSRYRLVVRFFVSVCFTPYFAVNTEPDREKNSGEFDAPITTALSESTTIYRHWLTSQLKPCPSVWLILRRLAKIRVCPQGTPKPLALMSVAARRISPVA